MINAQKMVANAQMEELAARLRAECAALQAHNSTLQTHNMALTGQIADMKVVLDVLAREQIDVLHNRVQRQWGARAQKGDSDKKDLYAVTHSADTVQGQISQLEAVIRALEVNVTWDGTYTELQQAGGTHGHLGMYGWDQMWGLGLDAGGFVSGHSRYKISKEERARRAAPVFTILRQRLTVLKATESSLSTLKNYTRV